MPPSGPQQVWVPGYMKDDGEWIEGFYVETHTPGYWQESWVPGYWAC